MIENEKNENPQISNNEENDNKQNENARKKMKNKNDEEAMDSEKNNSLLAELECLRQENDDLKKKLDVEHNNMLKVVADYENLKKRLYKDLEYRIKFANSELIKNLLPVIDHLEMAIHHTKEQKNIEALCEGVSLTLKQLKSILETFGLKEIAVGENEIFDPSRHEAMMLESFNDKENNSITKILQKGYTLHDSIVRPVKVAVNKKLDQKKEEENGK